MKLSIEGAICRLGKISNNTIKNGNKFETEFTIPFEGIMLTREQLNRALEDDYAWDSWYKTAKGKPPAPCDWWAHSKGEFPIPDDHEGKWLHIYLSGDQMIAFEEGEKKSEKEKVTAGFRISKIVFLPTFGGNTQFKGSFHVRPGLGRENLLLQEHQHREVRIFFGETKPVQKDSTQESLPLEPPKPVESNVVYANAFAEFHRRRAEALTSALQPAKQAADASVTPEPETESEAVNKSVTNDTGPASEAPSDAGSDHVTSQEARGDYELVEESFLPEVTKSQVDGLREAAEERRRQRAMARAAVTATTAEEFQRKIEQELDKFKERPDGVIDGTKQ